MTLRSALANTVSKAAAWLAGDAAKQRLRLVNGRERIAAAFGLSPAQLGTAMSAALGKGNAGWDSFGTLVAAFERYLLTDAHLASVYLSTRVEIAMLPWQILDAADDSDGEAIGEFVRTMLGNIPRFRRRVLYELTDGIGVGMAAVELDGEARNGRQVITGARGVEQWLLRPTDDGGYEYKAESGWQPVPPDKLLAWELDNKGSYKTGGMMWPSLWLALFKNFSFKDWISFLETYGQPLRVGWYGQGASQEDIDLLSQAVIDIATDAGVALPEGLKIEFKEAMGGDSEAYERLVKRIDMYFTILYTGGQLTVEAGDVGARSLGEVHERRSDARTRFWAEDLAESIDAGMIRKIVDWNFGPRAAYPRFSFIIADDAALKSRAEMDQGFLDRGVKIPESYFYETYGYPEPEDGEAVVQLPTAAPATPSSFFGRGHDRSRSALAKGPDAIEAMEAIAARGAEELAPLYAPLLDRLAGLAETADWSAFRLALERAATIADEIERAAAVEVAHNEAAAILSEALGNGGDEFAAEVSSRLGAWLPAVVAGGIAATVDDADREGVTRGIDWAAAIGESLTRLGAPTLLSRSALASFSPRSLVAAAWHAVSPRNALDYWAKRLGVTASVFANLDPAARRVAVSAAGIEKQAVINAVVDGVRRAIQDGETARDFRKRIDEAAAAAGMDPVNPKRAEFIFRQNQLTAYGAGRMASQHSDAVKKFLPFKELVTVGDTKVRASHRRLHGLTLPVDDPRWRQLSPPLDYGCRCGARSVRRPAPGNPTEIDTMPAVSEAFGDGGPLAAWHGALTGGAE